MMKEVYFWSIAKDNERIGEDFINYWNRRATYCCVGKMNSGENICLIVYIVFEGKGISVWDFAAGAKEVAKHVTFRVGTNKDMTHMSKISHVGLEYKSFIR